MTKIKLFLAGLTAILIASCSVEDGKDGVNGVGFDELVKDGAISLKLEGTRPDAIPFVYNSNFRFSGINLNDENISRVRRRGNDLLFTIRRYISAPDDTVQETYVSFELVVKDAGLATQSLSLDYVEFDDVIIIGNDHKYFGLNDYFDVDANSEGDPNFVSPISNVTITNYSFDATTYKLKVDFSFDVKGSANDSKNDLKVSGNADVKVYERIEEIGVG